MGKLKEHYIDYLNAHPEIDPDEHNPNRGSQNEKPIHKRIAECNSNYSSRIRTEHCTSTTSPSTDSSTSNLRENTMIIAHKPIALHVTIAHGWTVLWTKRGLQIARPGDWIATAPTGCTWRLKKEHREFYATGEEAIRLIANSKRTQRNN